MREFLRNCEKLGDWEIHKTHTMREWFLQYLIVSRNFSILLSIDKYNLNVELECKSQTLSF